MQGKLKGKTFVNTASNHPTEANGENTMQFFIIMQAENNPHPNQFSNGPHVLTDVVKVELYCVTVVSGLSTEPTDKSIRCSCIGQSMFIPPFPVGVLF